jgi:C4-dicarboxylate-specific signal transduction histidine kinase
MLNRFKKYIPEMLRDFAKGDTPDNILEQIMQAIWVIGLIVPSFVLTLEQTHNIFLTYALIAMAMTGGGCLLLFKQFKASVKKLGLFTAAIFNLALSIIVIKSPFFFGSTTLWFPVSLTLTIFVAGLRTGFVTLILLELVTIYHQVTKAHLGLNAPQEWNVNNWVNAVFVDRTVSLVTFYIFIYFLILSRKRIYQSLLQAKESVFKSSKLSEVGKVAANIAHEINNPITIISASNYLIAKELKKDNPDLAVIQKNVQSIDNVCERMTLIVNGMKKMSRDGSGDPFEEVNLSELLAETEVFIAARIKHDDIDFKIIMKNPNIKLNGRFSQLSQILINLINNAADAIEELPVKWIKVEIYQSQDFVSIMIVDSGPGIPKEIEDQVFEPLFTTKPAEKGTGLGLSIVHTIVEEHGGTLLIDRSFQDSRITINLPKKMAVAA